MTRQIQYFAQSHRGLLKLSREGLYVFINFASIYLQYNSIKNYTFILLIIQFLETRC